MVFNNYPVDVGAMKQSDQMETGEFNYFGQTNYPITIGVSPRIGLDLAARYDSTLIDTETVSAMMARFKIILEDLAEGIERPISSLKSLYEEEHQQLKAFNNTRRDFAHEQTLHGMFEKQAATDPNAPACRFGDLVISYGELDRRANQLAHHLIGKGVAPHQMVGVCLQRSELMPIALLAVLKAGAAYVPLNPEHPDDRIAYILEEVQAPICITDEATENAWLRHGSPPPAHPGDRQRIRTEPRHCRQL